MTRLRQHFAAATLLAAGFLMLLAGRTQAQSTWSAASTNPDGSFSIMMNVSQTDGSYSVYAANNTTTPWLVGGQTGFASGGNWFSNAVGAANPLTLIGSLPITGSDPFQGGTSLWGSYQGLQETWQTAGGIQFITVFKVYQSSPIVIFEQQFPNGVANSAYSNGISSAFPSFQTSGGQAASLGFLTFAGGFAASSKGTGLANIPTDPHSVYGLESGVPLALFDAAPHALVLSPLNNFKAGVQTRQSQLTGQLACGIQGQVTSLPLGFTHDTILYAGQGINNSFYGWGSSLKNYYGKDGSRLNNDLTNNYLGYWTDRGAYYYYSSEPNKDYQTTMLDIQAYHRQNGLPFRYYQLDSWWYYKSTIATNGQKGVYQWDAMPGTFAAGVPGLNSLMGGVPFVLHNRFWAPDNIYRASYNFIDGGSTGASCPNDPKFWPFLMDKVVQDGAANYEQDWLQWEVENCLPLQKDVSSARNWLLDMGTQADARNRTVQYCQALPSDYLESVEIPAVTQIRATGDYYWDANNWHIGTNSMLAWAVGLAPYKDTFWTSSSEPGNVNNGATEANPSLQELVAVLSTGPVGPGDGIGYTDKNLLMKSCRADGLLLKPDKPATPIDRSFMSGGPAGEVWDTYSDYGSRWHYLAALGLSASFNLTVNDLGITGSAVAYNYSTGAISTFDASHPLTLPSTGSYAYNYYVVAPVQANGWALLGETGKFVTVSHQRFSAVSADSMTVNLSGAAGDAVNLVWYAPSAPAGVVIDGSPVSQGSGWSYNTSSHLLTVSRSFGSAGASTIYVVSTAPAAPTNLAAIASDKRVDLSWSGSAGATSYSVKRALASAGPYTTIGMVGASTTSYSDTDPNLVDGTTYYYVVSASNTGVEGPNSAVVSALPIALPPAPTNLNAAGTSSSQVNLSWTDNSTDESGFKIEQSTDGANFTQVALAPANSVSYNVTGLAASTLYYFRVRATNSVGDSDYTNTASATTLDPSQSPPAAPSNLTASPVSGAQVNLAWTDNSTNENGFKIEQSTDNINFTQVATPPAGSTSYSVTGLVGKTTYFFRVRASNSIGDSGYSNSASAATPLLAPSGVTATATSSFQVGVSWSASAGATGYNIKRSTVSGGTYTTIQSKFTGTSYTDSTVLDGVTYYYVVSAVGGAESSNSSQVSAVTPLAVPTNLSAVTASRSRINLTWTDNSRNESGYKIERSLNGTSWTQITQVGANVTTYANTSLSRNTLYYYRVRAYNAASNSAYSTVASARTSP